MKFRKTFLIKAKVARPSSFLHAKFTRSIMRNIVKFWRVYYVKIIRTFILMLDYRRIMVSSIISKILNKKITNFETLRSLGLIVFGPRNLQGVLWEERLVQLVERHTPVEIRIRVPSFFLTTFTFSLIERNLLISER